MAIHKDTQGPAPDRFHVPTKDEWGALYNVWTALGGWSSDWTNFWIALKMPMAGYRGYSSSSISNQGEYGYYWASSRFNTNNAYRLRFSSTALSPQAYDICAFGFSVRCFKDSPAPPTSSWTKLYWTSIESWWIFWSSTDWLISSSSDWQTWITIMDKNLWATTVWNNWDTLSETNCGKYFQWWNNYSFPWIWNSETITTSSTKIDASTYWPWNYYSSSTFITVSSSPYNWDTTSNWNLRWWETNWTRWYPDMKLHWAIQTFHFQPTLMEAPDLIALVTTDIFWINFSDILNELNKYPQLYYGKNLSEWNLYTEYKSNVLWDWDWSAKVWEVTWRYITRYVVYYDSDTKVWNYYGHNISDYNI